MPKTYGVKKLYYDEPDESLEDVPLNFECHCAVAHTPRKPSPRLEKIRAAIKYFFSMKKND